MDVSEQVRSFFSVRDEGSLVKQDQEREVGKGKRHLQSICFMPGVLRRLSYLILKIVTTLFHQIYRWRNWGSNVWSDLFKVTQLANGGLRFKPLFEGLWSSCFTYFVFLLIDLRASVCFQYSSAMRLRQCSVNSNTLVSVRVFAGRRWHKLGLGKI